jgi:hypothetical protein
MQPMLDKKKLKSLLSILDTMEWAKKRSHATDPLSSRIRSRVGRSDPPKARSPCGPLGRRLLSAQARALCELDLIVSVPGLGALFNKRWFVGQSCGNTTKPHHHDSSVWGQY